VQSPSPLPASRFVPAFGLGNPHLQTLWGPLWRKTVHIERERERLWLEDGDFLDLDWHGPHSAKAPLVLVLHGLTGSSNSPYVAGIQKALAEQGWASVALNWRGLDDEAAAETVAERIAEQAKGHGLLIHRGRSVIELRAPVTSDKSDAVHALLDQVDVDNALYVGDDRTDLDAFRALRALQHEGRLTEILCVGVRSEQTPSELLAEADLLVDGTEGVSSLLSALAD